MFKRKVEDVDELFVKTKTKTKAKTSVTKTVGIEIPDFLEKIDKKVKECCPRFMLAGVEFIIEIDPGFDNTEFVDVGLANLSDEDQITSVTFTHESGAKESWQMDELKAKRSSGFPDFLSHEKYKAWAKDHGDVFKLMVTVTLHQKEESAEDGWIRYVGILYGLFNSVWCGGFKISRDTVRSSDNGCGD